MLEIKWWLLILALGIVFFMLINRSVKQPLKWFGYGVLYSVVGAIILFFVNLLGEYIQLHIPINPITALITGILGLPGLAYLIAVKMLWI
ncbi:pro-sigmaK processing inhibitor BofA family protein [Thermoflavimicrobium dichotomicum]|uniref:Inhibitor of the pro-sigma K processing machinery n=1 Tax=Thermoflavimicrobium dichotomicum TaxID=46223 RepID=A0A1I3KKP4_9BACL|nr:pro-sigmaK processing inhibitor BofA family protein [Thermoflavimicrobium dichotomicum]SFI72964.1 inhibitor of the pro-sigma K processing machinery [Thermoflavimicrobium dichotomicum]